MRVSDKLANSTGWKASGPLSFLHDYSYQLGAEILTPFGVCPTSLSLSLWMVNASAEVGS